MHMLTVEKRKQYALDSLRTFIFVVVVNSVSVLNG